MRGPRISRARPVTDLRRRHLHAENVKLRRELTGAVGDALDRHWSRVAQNHAERDGIDTSHIDVMTQELAALGVTLRGHVQRMNEAFARVDEQLGAIHAALVIAGMTANAALEQAQQARALMGAFDPDDLPIMGEDVAVPNHKPTLQ
jgi:hypothetical protein